MDLVSPTFDESAILSRVIAPASPALDRQAAAALAELEFAAEDVARMNELSEKNRRGEANEADLAELEAYSRIGSLLNLLKAKARRSLADG